VGEVKVEDPEDGSPPLCTIVENIKDIAYFEKCSRNQ
jgi:hypothetical protein